MFARVKAALSSKSMLATRSGGIRFRMYSCAEEIRRLLGSFQTIDPDESIAARDVAHSAPYSCAGRTATTVSWRNMRTTRSVNIVATVDATASESLRKGRGMEDYAGLVDALIKTFPSENHS